MPLEHLVPQIALVVGASVALLVALSVPRSRQWWTAVVTAGALGAGVGFQADLLGGRQLVTFHGLWALDGVTHWAAMIVMGATAVAVVLSPEWMRTDARHGEYHVMLVLAAVGATVLVAATDLNELIVGLVLSTVTGYVLAGYHRRSALSVEAGMKLFLIGGLGNSLLLIGAVLLYGLSGSTSYQEIGPALTGAPTAVLVAIAALVVAGLAVELGAVPAHAWMPDVAQGSPAPAAGFLLVVPKIGALVATARFVELLPGELVGWRPMLAVVAAATMTVGNLGALWQDDVRRLLGWSSISQSGYGLMAVVALGRSGEAVPALLYFVLAYAAANLAAFGVVTELRGRTALEDYRGVAATRPWLSAVLAVAMLSFVGIPPLAGFTAKLLLFGATIDAGYGWLAALAVANTVVSLFYYLRVVAPMYLDLAPDGTAVPVLGRWAAVGTAVAGVAVVGVGLLSGPLLAGMRGASLLP